MISEMVTPTVRARWRRSQIAGTVASSHVSAPCYRLPQRLSEPARGKKRRRARRPTSVTKARLRNRGGILNRARNLSPNPSPFRRGEQECALNKDPHPSASSRQALRSSPIPGEGKNSQPGCATISCGGEGPGRIRDSSPRRL